MFNHPLGFLWSYDFSLNSPLMHQKKSETTAYASRAVCLPLINIPQTVVETRFFFFKAAVCAFVSQEPLTTTEEECM